MRTTLDLDEDVLFAIRQIAKEKEISMGKALSELAREVILPQKKFAERNGVPLLPKKPNSGIVTMELVNRLRDETQ